MDLRGIAREELSARLKPNRCGNPRIAGEGILKLANFGSNLDGKDFAIINEMFGLLVHKMEADLVTKEIDISLAIPEWMGSAMGENGMMSLVGAFACSTRNEARHGNAAVLAEFVCTAKGHRHFCHDCKRLKRAA